MDIVEFLRGRLDEDEAVARDEGADAMIGHRWKHLPEADYNAIQSATLDHARRVLREVEAKRRMLDDIVGNDYFPAAAVTDGLSARWLYWTAAVYSDHPDYDPEWAD